MEQLAITLDGMACGGCVKNARRALNALPGVTIEHVAVGSALLALDPSRASKQTVIEALRRAGYPAREAGAPAANIAEAKGGHCGV
jgi:copper chaperone CopZ